jgi:hypothetical protein
MQKLGTIVTVQNLIVLLNILLAFQEGLFTKSMKKVALLGSTGSIGVSTLDVISAFPDKFKVVALAANSNIELVKKQIELFRPEIVSISNHDSPQNSGSFAPIPESCLVKKVLLKLPPLRITIFSLAQWSVLAVSPPLSRLLNAENGLPWQIRKPLWLPALSLPDS